MTEPTIKVRVRIAPSPTGYVHIGNLRTILYNYLFARHHHGAFIVRIEDTDRSRFVPGAMEDLLRTLEWAGFDYDEGPKIIDNKIEQVGEYGPYIQSERLDIYQNQIKVLVEKGKAYHCFCSKERLDNLRADQEANKLPPKYDGLCRNLSQDEVRKRLTAGEPSVIRFKMPEEKEVLFEDVIRGTIKFNTRDLDDFVLIKADGYPTYHFANIIDDHQMKITHVLRADEWIPSTPKHTILYDAFGWQAPLYAHLPPVLGKNKKKMSKRDGDVSVKDFIKAGYLKDALINFIALLGWNAGTEQEIYSLEEMKNQFSLDNVHKAGAVFDPEKLDWLNGMYLRKMSDEEFTKLCIPELVEKGIILENNETYKIAWSKEEVSFAWLKKVCALEKDRIKRLNEISPGLQFIFEENLNYDGKILIWKKSDTEKARFALVKLIEALATVEEGDYTRENIEKQIMAMIEANNLSNGEVLWPMRVALSGSEQSPGPFDIAAVLGKDKTLIRLKDALIKI
jgi:nondiscriminating glutamyl-tRNA synthetase